MTTWTTIAPASALPDGSARSFGKVTVFNQGGRLHACASRCPHMGYPMDKGTIRDGVVTCAWHKWEFDLGTGGCYRGASQDLAVHPIRIVDGSIQVALDHDAPHDTAAGLDRPARMLREGMLAGDIYQQAKAMAALFEHGADAAAVAAIAAEQGFVHSALNHQNIQAVRELTAIVESARLASHFSGRDRIGVILQGVRAAGGSAGERAAVHPLPGGDRAGGSDLLARYVRDSSPLAIERLLLDPAMRGEAVDALLLDLATRPCFLPHREVLLAVSAVLDAGSVLGAHADTHRPALLAWTLGIQRSDPEAEERAAMAWLIAHHDAIATLRPEVGAAGHALAVADIDALASSATGEAALARLLDHLRDGAGFTPALDAFSEFCARRFEHLRPNNGGLWDTAIEGLHLCHAIRTSAPRGSDAFRVQALFALAWHVFESRWLHHGSAWHVADTEAGDWDSYAHAFAASDVALARRQAVAAYARDRGDPRRLLDPLLREDLGIDQLMTISAVLGEERHVTNWQPLIAGLVTYILDGRSRQAVHAAARFGRSMAGEG